MAAGIPDWGSVWEPVEPHSPLEKELLAELGGAHPLAPLRPGVFGRCLACDDVVVGLDYLAGDRWVCHSIDIVPGHKKIANFGYAWEAPSH